MILNTSQLDLTYDCFEEFTEFNHKPRVTAN